MLILIHSMFSIVALIIGTINLIKIKGTKAHKILGRVFVVSMFLSASSSFWIFNKRFSVIHILSVLVLFWLFKAVYAVKFKPKNWLHIHASAIGSAYIAIIIAGTGVIVRKILLPGNTNAGFLVSAFTAMICIPLLIKMTTKYQN